MHINSKTATAIKKANISTSFGDVEEVCLEYCGYLMALFMEEACMEKMRYQPNERMGCKQPESTDLIGL
jgi:hypothetical protein